MNKNTIFTEFNLFQFNITDPYLTLLNRHYALLYMLVRCMEATFQLALECCH